MTHAIGHSPAHTTTELAIADFLEAYVGHTRQAYTDDLRIFRTWCLAHSIDLLDVTRRDLEQYARYLVDERGNKVVTMKRRMHSIRRFYRITAADGRIRTSPAEQVRLPRRYRDQDEDNRPYLDRMELARVLAAGRAGRPAEAAMVALLGLLGLRVGEAIALQIADYQDIEEGHRVLKFTGKGGKHATMPIPVPVLRLLDAAAAGRAEGPLLIRRDGTAYPYRAAHRLVARLAKEAGVDKHITPHALRRSFVSAGLDAGVSIRDMQTAGRWTDPRMVMRYDVARHSHDRSAVYSVCTYIAGVA